ncbi:(R)-2-hydroxyglutaryl-CoA dehydratase activating ATPase [bioreactor metagenome]|uniref:(R)-2-hydroxyglutaryl-CoA dehydratase activating ATPase n=1 Tax=bioreactor metagenome TaxID=1076179 RepID=A0A644WR66_9ZZZZ
MGCVFTMGVDIGSTSSKCVIVKDGKDIIAKSLVSAGTGTSGPERAIRQILDDTRFKLGDLSYILATGYGRSSVGIANSEMSELSCHAKGAYYLFPDVHTVIDIGGQDAKAMRIGSGGMLESFVMNDKCAAGTGRFLEVMARILELDVGDLEKLGAESKNPVSISSTCTVFAESEVISQLAQGSSRSDIIAGIHRSVAGRVSGLVKRVGVVPSVVMTGGVAQNAGVRRELEKELGVEIFTSPLAQYAGAIGAALFAYRKAL